MSKTEFVIRLIAKLLLIAGLIVVIIGGFAVENDMSLAVRLGIVGICMAAPDIIINLIEEMYLSKEDK